MDDQTEDLHLLPDAELSFADWTAGPGGEGLSAALERKPDEVVEEVRASGLRGRGGAGFPTGMKWASVAEAAVDGEDVYVVCNAAEGEPGTAKDRALMARNPFQLVEGICVAMYATRAAGAFIAVKERFTHERARLEEAVEAARDAGWRGADRIRIVHGPDEYLFGEESAMLEVIEGSLPLPRWLPPYQVGLWATSAHPHPTVVNNVETLCHVTHIARAGADQFRRQGTETSPGTMVFTVMGDVDAPGVYELPLGTTLRELVVDIAGATSVKAIASGVSNVLITPAHLDLPLDFDVFAEAGVGLGSGGFIVYDESRCMVQVTAVLARFLAVESCGQCTACKFGTGEMWKILDDLVEGRAGPGVIDSLRRHLETVTNQHRCYLPVGAQLTIGSLLESFPDDVAARLESPTPADVRVTVPKITAIDQAEGVVHLDGDYVRKRRDWTYADSVVTPSPTADADSWPVEGSDPDHTEPA